MAIIRLLDVAIIVFSFWLATRVYGPEWTGAHTVAVAIASLLYAGAAQANRLYEGWRGSAAFGQLARVLAVWAVVIAVLATLAFVAKQSDAYSRVQVGMWFALTAVALVAARLVQLLFLREVRRRGYNTRSVAFAGCSDAAEQLARRIAESPWSGLRIHGFYDDRETRPAALHRPHQRIHSIPAELGPIRGNLETLIRDVRDRRIDIVYITLPVRAETRIRTLTAALTDTTATVYVLPDVFVRSLLESRWTAFEDVPMLSVQDSPFDGVAGWLKRVEDILLGVVILLILAVPLLVLAIAVKLSSPGPILFRQRRYGLNGEPIRVLKFRTMKVCEDGPVVQQATKNDARITRLGAFMRRTSLDELPQFLQVLTGEMSVVGPRPHAVAHNEHYRRLIKGYMLRHKVKPGITGWAQVNGWRGETDTVEKMAHRIEHDLAYINRWSLWLDLRIVWLTVFGRKAHQNAY